MSLFSCPVSSDVEMVWEPAARLTGGDCKARMRVLSVGPSC